MRRLCLLVALAAAGCTGALQGGIPNVITPPTPQHRYAAVAFSNNKPLQGARCWTERKAGTVQDGVTNNDGYILFEPTDEGFRTIACSKDGYQEGHTVFNNNGTADPATGYPNVRVVLTKIKPPLPPKPSREELATAQLTFQGLSLDCPGEYTGPIFDVMIDVLSESCRQHFYESKRAAGDKVIAVAISHAYYEAGVPEPIQRGIDWTQNLEGFRVFLEEIITAGFYVQLHLAGDGDCTDNGYMAYCDTVGQTYGYEWLINNIGRITDVLAPVLDYSRTGPGFDGVFYGWEPSGEKIPRFAAEWRQRRPNDVLFLEFNTGHIPIGEGGDDYLPGGRMKDYDLILAELESTLKDRATYQILGRMLPDWHEMSGQVDDFQRGTGPDREWPPFYLKFQNFRGPFYFNCFEWNLYDWVRSRVSLQQLQTDRQRLVNAGCTIVG